MNKVKNKTCFVQRETQADIFIKMIILKSASGLHALIKRLLKSQQKKEKHESMLEQMQLSMQRKKKTCTFS